MRIGAQVYGYDNAEQWAVRHVTNGYGATYFPLNHMDDPDRIEEYADAARRHGLIISEVGIWNNQLERDPLIRERNIGYAVAQLKLADHIGARCCVNISGSLSDIWDGHHPDNLSEENFRQVVSICQRIIDIAQPKNAFYTLEPMPWMFPHTIEDMSRLIHEVHRDMFAVHVDMCNMVNSFDHVYATGALVREFFSEFAPLIRCVHAKDTVIGNRLTLHIDEAIPGEGIFDYNTLFKECAKLDPDLPVMAEHLKTETEYLQATGFMKKKAASLGINLLTGY
jgi:sugar phosphate isomerase/epimerase